MRVGRRQCFLQQIARLQRFHAAQKEQTLLAARGRARLRGEQDGRREAEIADADRFVRSLRKPGERQVTVRVHDALGELRRQRRFADGPRLRGQEREVGRRPVQRRQRGHQRLRATAVGHAPPRACRQPQELLVKRLQFEQARALAHRRFRARGQGRQRPQAAGGIAERELLPRQLQAEFRVVGPRPQQAGEIGDGQRVGTLFAPHLLEQRLARKQHGQRHQHQHDQRHQRAGREQPRARGGISPRNVGVAPAIHAGPV